MKSIFLSAVVALLIAASASHTAAQWHTELNYGSAFTTDRFHEFLPSAGFWNWQYQVRKEVNDRYEVGGSVAWSYFEHDFGRITRTGEAIAVTANTVHYTNILAFQFVNQLNLTDPGEAVPFLRLGIGAAHQSQQENVGLFSLGNSGWQFMLNPEAGVRIALRDDLGLVLAGGYSFLPESGGLLPTSFWSLKAGLSWSKF